MNLYQGFRENPGWDPERVFLRDLRTGMDYSYAELDRWTARLAHRLGARFGIRAGDRVACQVEKSPIAYFLYLACLRAGAVFLPLNTTYLPVEVDHFLGDATPRLLVADPARASGLRESAARIGALLTTLDAEGRGELIAGFDSAPAEYPTLDRADADLAAIVYTSGTTGRSKGAMLTHGNLRANAAALTRAWGFTPDDRLLHALPIYHVHGLFISMHCVLTSLSTVLWMPRFEAAEALRHLERATVFMGVPTYYTRLLEEPRLAAPGIRLFVSGSAPLRPETFAEFERRAGSRILERYGMTETGVIASNPLRGERRAGSVGPPLDGVQARIAPADGMIEVRGPGVFPGYWQQPERTREEFTADGFFRTGDLGQIDADGYVSITGRARDLVICGGLNVYPKEIELVLDGLEGVAESAVFGVPHPDFGEAVVAAVVPRDPAHPPREEALVADLRLKVAAFKAPKRVFVLPTLPRNAMAKVQKARLRELFAGVFAVKS